MSVFSLKRDDKDNRKVHIVLKKVDIEHPVIKIVFLHQIQESMKKMLLTICFLHLVCSEQILDNNGIDEQVEKEGESKGKDYYVTVNGKGRVNPFGHGERWSLYTRGGVNLTRTF